MKILNVKKTFKNFNHLESNLLRRTTRSPEAKSADFSHQKKLGATAAQNDGGRLIQTDRKRSRRICVQLSVYMQ
jgi:hypothetical protein